MRVVDPRSPEFVRDPYPQYEWMRDEAPVYHVPGSDIWAVTRFADVDACARNPAVFSSTGGVGPEWKQQPMMSMHDPPEHTRLRRIVAKQFTPKYVATLAPHMQETVDALLEGLLVGGEVDFVTRFAEPLVATVIADVLGIPEERRHDFRRWSHSTVSVLAAAADAEASEESERTRAEFVAYLKGVVRERSQAPAATGTDIIHSLLAARQTEALTPREVTAFCVLLLVAGFETTVNGLVNVANVLLTRPDVWRTVQSDPALVTSMIEEGLRFDAPVQAFFRNTLAAATVAGTDIPVGQKVMLLFGSANRDPRAFPSADVYDVRRNPTNHIGFGAGVHHCIGAPLARTLYELTWRRLFERVREMSPSGEALRTINPLLRGFRSLPVVARAL